MSVCLNYNETVTLVLTTVDNYGSDVADEQAAVPAIIEQNTGTDHAQNQQAVTSDMIVYVDPTNAFVVANWNRLEEMLVVAALFDVPTSEAWFKVIGVTVARDHLLGNKIDNIRLQLKKTRGIANVS